MGTALYSGLPGTLSSSFWQKKIIVMAKKKNHHSLQWSAGYTLIVVAFLVDYIVLYEKYLSFIRDLLQCQKRPTTVSK